MTINRDALRDSYLAAYRRLHNTNNLPNLSYENGWWIFRNPNGWLTSRYRTAKLVAMRDHLERLAAAKAEIAK